MQRAMPTAPAEGVRDGQPAAAALAPQAAPVAATEADPSQLPHGLQLADVLRCLRELLICNGGSFFDDCRLHRLVSAVNLKTLNPALSETDVASLKNAVMIAEGCEAGDDYDSD